MKLNATLLLILLFFSAGAIAQNITGIWKGYFVQKTFGYIEDRYRFEVQIEQLPNNALNGVTYSYKTTVFYGKADVKGIYTKKTNNIVLNETKMVDMKIGDQSQPCLMTCYLEYDKMGNLQTLTGTYTSRVLKDGTDCGNGKVYLEKTTETDFYKEDFLLKLEKKKPAPNTTVKAKPPVTKPTPKPNVAPIQKGVKPGAESHVLDQAKGKPTEPSLGSIAAPQKKEVIIAPPVEKPALPKPEIMKKRANELAKTITTSAKTIKIDLYDNGEIDGDIISVYHNNKLIVNKKQLAHKPISITIDMDSEGGHHEFVLVAENLGSIPPNTALMVVTANSKRYELFITSTEQKNAVVAIEYKPED